LLRLGISTAHQSIEALKRLLEREVVEFIELGTGESEKSEEAIRNLGRRSIEFLHGLPFMDFSTRDFMFNPCYKPLEAAMVLDRMVAKASQLGLEYRFYGVHAGLLGSIAGPESFTIRDSIEASKGIENLAIFRNNIKEASKVILENIYGWDRSARAIGMTQEEMEKMGKHFHLLLDIGHAAINFEMYEGLSLDELRVDNLPVEEVHLSFLNKSGPPPWDHRGFSETEENLRIVSKLKEVVELFPDIPVVLEIGDGERVVEETVARIWR
jgi:hypothetical protein